MKLEDLVEQYDRLKRVEVVDLSKDQDLALAIMNLIGIEEHLFFTGAKTENNKYYDLIEEVRELRKNLLKQLIPDYEGEVWCISKHLLAASYRLMEVGTKLLHQEKSEKAYQHFEQAFKLYTLFWGINLKLLTSADGEYSSVKESVVDQPKINTENIPTTQTKMVKKTTWMDKFSIWVKKALDCCKE